MNLSSCQDLMRLLGDPTRARLLSLLSSEELSVAELVRATRLPQSRVSTHLGRLREAGLVVDRPEGPACFYRANEQAMPPAARRLWQVVSESTRDPLLEQDR